MRFLFVIENVETHVVEGIHSYLVLNLTLSDFQFCYFFFYLVYVLVYVLCIELYSLVEVCVRSI